MKAVVFDIDDTLYLERDYVRSGFRSVGNYVQAHYGVDDFGSCAWALFSKGIRGDTFDRVIDLLDLSSKHMDVARLIDVYRTHQPDIVLLDDAVAALNACQMFQLPTAVVTDGPASSQWAKIEALGIRDAANLIVVTSDKGAGWEKPHPLAFEYIQSYLQGDPGDLIYIADNPLKDFIAPDALGWRTWRVRRPDSLRAEVSSGPDVHIETASLASFEQIVSLR